MEMDRLLVELRSQYDAKLEEAERYSLKDAATVEEAEEYSKKSAAASEEMEAIGKKIMAYNEAKQQREAVNARLIKAREMAKPNRGLPFAGGPSTGSPFNGTIGDDGDMELPPSQRSEFKRFARKTLDTKGGFIIEAGDSEIDKRAPHGGFKSLGHFAWCVMRRGIRGDGDPHSVQMLKSWQDLQLKAPSGMFEESDPDGGDLIPREFSNKIYERMMDTNQILPYLQGLPLSGNTLTIPALKEDSRADLSRHGGVLGYWEGEADQYTKVSPKFRNINLKLHKLTVLTYVTEELLMDSAVALESYLGRLVPREVNFKINDALINGTGGGMPLGMLKCNSKVTVTGASTGITSGTFSYIAVPNMWQRAIASQRANAIWLYNQDVEGALYKMYLATGTAAGVAVFTPNEAVQIKLMSRPALVMEQCQTMGTEGDVILFCPDGYAVIIKGGLQSFMSMHLRFDYDEFAYKWRFRMDAQPYDDVALTAYKGSNTYSSVVTLNSTRS